MTTEELEAECFDVISELINDSRNSTAKWLFACYVFSRSSQDALANEAARDCVRTFILAYRQDNAA